MTKRQYNQRLNWRQIKEIRERLAAGETGVSVAHAFNLSHVYVSRIKHKDIWPKLPTGRRKGSGATFIRVDTRPGKTTGLFIGRKLWQQLGEPERVMLQAFPPPDQRVIIHPAAEGYKIIRTAQAMPRLAIGREALAQLGLTDGRYPGHIDGRGNLCIAAVREAEADEWMLTREARARLTISRERLRQVIEAGKIQARRINGWEYMVLRADVLAYHARQQEREVGRQQKADQPAKQPEQRLPPPERNCLYCGQPLLLFRASDKQQFCSQSHAQRHRWEQRRKERSSQQNL